jgi:RNA recognition motif-containing protein
MNIYVGNLHYGVGEDQLSEVFEAYGEVTSVKIIKDKFTGNSKGFGFVEMADDEAAKQAMEALNNSEIQGRAMKVNEARQREERPRRSY